MALSPVLATIISKTQAIFPSATHSDALFILLYSWESVNVVFLALPDFAG